MLPELPDPTPEPIERFSPSLVNDLLACPRRAGFARDASFKVWRRPSTFSVLGEAAHAVVEAVTNRHAWPSDRIERRRELESLWEASVRNGATKLRDAWAPAVPPPVEEWPTYHVTKARCLRRAERTITERSVPPGGVMAPPGPKGATGAEIALVDATSGCRSPA